MTRTPDADPDGAVSSRKKGRLPITMALDALLSVTFLVLAAYIGFYASRMNGADGRDLFWFSLLLGAYGIWRAIRSLIRHRQRNEES
ncbi:hypothetical protein EST62_10215 [Chlorobaculum sp. 24CR]|uniref:hypothetical protein n=1 Tax=Chlorobaculum sp. 24CR TaxID=2508878 RepID=UPI00100B0A1B|nr:hypothetical protein [Chlorobaculum sp. 24CR]RXK82741.1 hypothetical protein EST62_10215 [Chlorobaculum sp. 24CR]